MVNDAVRHFVGHRLEDLLIPVFIKVRPAILDATKDAIISIAVDQVFEHFEKGEPTPAQHLTSFTELAVRGLDDPRRNARAYVERTAMRRIGGGY